MAKCRQRQAANRRLISDRTAKGLRTLAAPQHVYRDRTGRGVAARRPLNLSDYLSVPPEERDPDDDNDGLENMIDPSGTIEGARMNSDLSVAYSSPGRPSTEPHISPATPHLHHMPRSATRREDWVLLLDTPDGWAPPSPTAAPRQPSIRRPPARSRTDFTSRRSSGREGNNAGPSVKPDADDSAAPVTTSSPLSPNTTSVPPRRFFPSRRPELLWGPALEPRERDPQHRRRLGNGDGDTRGRARHHNLTRSRSARSSCGHLATRSSRSCHRRWPICAVLRVAPRLRRGGLRPRESPLA